MKVVGAVVLIIIVALGAGWLVAGNEFFLYKYFAPRTEAVRRQTYEQSKAYRQGAVQELQNMQFEYVKADKAHQAALAEIILHRAADVDPDVLPRDLREFIQTLKEAR